MCVSRPGRVLRRLGDTVEVEIGGERRLCSALTRPEVRAGDRVLVHANLVLTILTEEEAADMEEIVAEVLGGGRDAT